MDAFDKETYNRVIALNEKLEQAVLLLYLKTAFSDNLFISGRKIWYIDDEIFEKALKDVECAKQEYYKAADDKESIQ